jgi:hypothetical protein
MRSNAVPVVYYSSHGAMLTTEAITVALQRLHQMHVGLIIDRREEGYDIGWVGDARYVEGVNVCNCSFLDRSVTGHRGECQFTTLMVAGAINAARDWADQGLVGVRIWSVDANQDRRLRSWVADFSWEEEVGPSRCVNPISFMKSGDMQVSSGCARHARCGFYAWKPGTVSGLPRGGLHAIGVITLHGKVFEHAYGYRAEYAKVREVFIPSIAVGNIDIRAYPGVRFHTLDIS